MKRVLTFVLLVFVILSLVSCRNGEDPFTALSDGGLSLVPANDESTNSNGGDPSEDDETSGSGGVLIQQPQPEPDEDFYSYTAKEAFEKYGLFTSESMMIQACDGEHIYVTDKDGVLCRSDYPSGENHATVCTDPLCTHKPGSSCPLGNLRSMFSVACYGGKLYYAGVDGNIYVYTPEKNESKRLLSKCSKATFQRTGGQLFVINPEEDPDFKSANAVYRIAENGEAVKLGSSARAFTNGFLVHSDSTVVGFDIASPDGRSPAEVILYDFKTQTEKKVFERAFPELPGDDSDFAGIFMSTIFGDKVLFNVRFSYRVDGDPEKEVENAEIWLVDVVTGEKRLLTTVNDYSTVSASCRFSEKYVCTVDRRDTEDDHYVLRVLDPFSGEESTYDLTEAAANAGETIPLKDCRLYSFDRFAPVLTMHYHIPYSGVNDDGTEFTSYRLKMLKYLAFDLESGRVYKYPQ